MDSGGTRGLRRFEEVSNYPTHLGGPWTPQNLQLYISATSNVVSTASIIERGESNTNRKIQYPVDFVGEVLSDSKNWYFHIMCLCITNHVSQAIPLLSSTPDWGPYIIDSRWDIEQ
jgi:hypothetical protein